jgi:hypothetical protein
MSSEDCLLIVIEVIMQSMMQANEHITEILMKNLFTSFDKISEGKTKNLRLCTKFRKFS